MGLTIRPASQRERDEAAKQWASSFTPGARDVTVGSTARTIAQRLWKRAHRMLVGELVVNSECHVIHLDDVPTEPLGWVCYVPGGELHYVYVVDKARQCGLGTKLVSWARMMGAGVTPSDISHMTASGRKLVHDGQETEAQAEAAPGILSG